MSFRPAHHCAVCPQIIQGYFLMCIPHWRLVPHEQQQAVYRTWRHSQRVMGRSGYAAAVHAEYFAARDNAIDSAREALGMPTGPLKAHPPKEQAA